MKKLVLGILMVFVLGCTKDDKPNVTFEDLPSVVIGTQTWTSKNLDITTYRDGTPIPQVTDPTQWQNLTTGAWCYYNNDPAAGTTYGKLYNWYAVAGIHDNDDNTPNKILAPTGWHVPSDAEWTTLTTFLGGDSVAGRKMKESGTSHWISPNTNATNSSGFNGIPAGIMASAGWMQNAQFEGIGNRTVWWSSTENNNVLASYLSLDNSSSSNLSFNDELWKSSGFSIRCIID
jgi:uncharacterized protein (TIGR02145 family)